MSLPIYTGVGEGRVGPTEGEGVASWKGGVVSGGARSADRTPAVFQSESRRPLVPRIQVTL